MSSVAIPIPDQSVNAFLVTRVIATALVSEVGYLAHQGAETIGF